MISKETTTANSKNYLQSDWSIAYAKLNLHKSSGEHSRVTTTKKDDYPLRNKNNQSTRNATLNESVVILEKHLPAPFDERTHNLMYQSYSKF